MVVRRRSRALASAALAALALAAATPQRALAQVDDTVDQSSLPIQVGVEIEAPPNGTFAASQDTMTVNWEALPLDSLAFDPDNATVVVRLCWAKADIADRPWRKFKDPIDKDRQCKNKVKADTNTPFSDGTTSFLIGGNQPAAFYWARVLVIDGGAYVATGGSADAGSDPQTTDCDLMESLTDLVCETFEVTNVLGTSVGLYVAIGLTAALGPAVLAIFMFFERFRGAKDFEGGAPGIAAGATAAELPTSANEVEVAGVN